MHNVLPELVPGVDLQAYLEDYANHQLTIVLTPKLMQLRRVVIGEAGRFPELGKALYEGGPKRAMAAMAAMFQHLAKRGLLRIDDAVAAASHFNWLVTSQPLNQAMLLGDAGIPKPSALRRYATDGCGCFSPRTAFVKYPPKVEATRSNRLGRAISSLPRWGRGVEIASPASNFRAEN